MHVIPKSIPIIFSALQVSESIVKVRLLCDCSSVGVSSSCSKQGPAVRLRDTAVIYRGLVKEFVVTLLLYAIINILINLINYSLTYIIPLVKLLI